MIASDGERVGTVGSVLAAPEKDVFHGLLIKTPGHGIRFLQADAIASIHERGVDLRIDSSAAHELPAPEHKAPVYDEDPDQPHWKWHHWVNVVTGRSDWNRER